MVCFLVYGEKILLQDLDGRVGVKIILPQLVEILGEKLKIERFFKSFAPINFKACLFSSSSTCGC